MNRIIKRVSAFVAVVVYIFGTTASRADDEYLQYQYDAAGNRIGRTVVQTQPRQSPKLSLPAVEVTVSPTLTHDEVTISTAQDIEKHSMRYTLINLQGSLLEAGQIGSQQTVLSLGQYADGIYLLTIESDSLIKSYKIIKQ